MSTIMDTPPTSVEPTPSLPPLLRFESVSRAFGALNALDGITLDVARGEVFGIIGRSGAGKSTLIRTVNRLERIDSGRILVDGHDVASLKPPALNRLRRRIGMIFQNFNLLSIKTVFENVELPLKLAGQLRQTREREVWRLLELVGLRDKADVYPAKLSGGQKQRVGIARALVTAPDLLLSDEATSALDPETTLSILQLLKELQATLGLTVVLITHEMSVIREICDRVAVLDRGRIVEQGSVWEIFARPRAEVTRRLLRTERPALPEDLRRRLRESPSPGGRTLLRLGSSDADRFEGSIAALAADPAWQAQIVHAEVDRIGGHSIGSVTFSIRYPGDDEFHGLLSALRGSTDVEVLGHDPG